MRSSRPAARAALLAYHRSQRFVWLAVAGVAVALAIRGLVDDGALTQVELPGIGIVDFLLEGFLVNLQIAAIAIGRSHPPVRR